MRRSLAEGRTPVPKKGHLGDDRNLGGESAYGTHCLGRFEHAAEGLEQDEIHARFEEHARLLFEDLAHLRQVQRTVGLHQRAERSDRAGDENEIPGGGFLREAHAFAVDLFERVGPLVRRELDAVGVPGVGREDARPGFEIIVVDLPHRLGIGGGQR